MNKRVERRLEELIGNIAIATAKMAVCAKEIERLKLRAEVVNAQTHNESVRKIRMLPIIEERKALIERCEKLNQRIELWMVEADTLRGLVANELGGIGKPYNESSKDIN